MDENGERCAKMVGNPIYSIKCTAALTYGCLCKSCRLQNVMCVSTYTEK